ncbi:MAG: HNH endonuclease [Sphingomonadaceae bacterium]
MNATVERRFAAKVQRSEDGCWIWTGCLNSRGYGLISVEGRPVLTHRWVYEFVNGPIPQGFYVHHTCGVRRCCNPEHLRLATHAQNMAEMRAAGRSTRGARNPRAKLTEAEVLEIRARYAAGNVSQSALARRYGVTPPSINDIVHRVSWRDLLAA